MTRIYCEHCRRETYQSRKARKARIGAPISICLAPDEDGLSECIGFTAGRRAGLKEALSLANSEADEGDAISIEWLRRTIRAALKPRKS